MKTKKVLIGLLVWAISIPAMAGVTVTTDETVAGQVKLTLTSDSEIVGIALNVDADANIASFTVDDDLGTPANSFFDVFMDVAYDQEVNGDGYVYGEGAGPDNTNGAYQGLPGVVALPATSFSISVGGPGGPANPLDPAPQVVQVILKGAAGTVVDIDLDLLRDGIVDYNGTQTAIGLPVQLTIPAPMVSVEIVSAHGTPTPAVGTYTNSPGTVLTNSVGTPDVQGTTQYVCTGWTMTGNEPASGSTNVMAMTHTNDAVLIWQWTTNSDVTAQGTPIWWLESHGLAEGDDTEDGDNDGLKTWEEWVCDTIPVDSNSVLKITNIQPAELGMQVHWQGGVQATQSLERNTNLVSGIGWKPLFTNEPPTSVTTNFTDPAATNPAGFYRIKVER